MKNKKILSPVNNSLINIFQQQDNSLNSKDESILISRMPNSNDQQVQLLENNDKLP